MRDPGNSGRVWHPSGGRRRWIAAHKAQVGVAASDDREAAGVHGQGAHGTAAARQVGTTSSFTHFAQTTHVPQDAGVSSLPLARPQRPGGEPDGETRTGGIRDTANAGPREQQQPGSSTVDMEVPSRLSIQQKAGEIDGLTDRQARKDFS